MPTGDGRCGVCGYWHEPGGHHIGRPAEQPMRFPSRAERQQIARMVTNPSPDDSPAARQFEAGWTEKHEQRQMRALAQWGRQRLIERAVRDVRPNTMSLRIWESLLAGHVEYRGVFPCLTCDPFVALVRARFREIAG